MYTVRIFMKCTHVCVAQITYLFFIKLYRSLADEIAKTCPDMNIKVALLQLAKSLLILKCYIKLFMPFKICPACNDCFT